jgi:hypothetical protein
MFLVFGYSVHGQGNLYDNMAEIRIYFQETNWRQILDSLFANYGEERRLKGNVVVNGKLFKEAGIRYKGFSSWEAGRNKNPLNIALDYTFKNSNYQGYSKLRLSNVLHDPSFVREVLSYEMARKYMPASQAFFANVYVNDELVGLYTNVESVDDRFLEKNFENPKLVLFKGNPSRLEYPFGQNSNLALVHGTDSSGYMPFYKLESGYGWEKLYSLIFTLNNDVENLPSVLNIDRTLWMHAFNYALVNLDSYIGYAQNFYLYLDENERFNPMVWDLNQSFGSFRLTDGTTLNLNVERAKRLNPLQHQTAATFSPRPLTKNLFQDSTLRKMYIAHLRTIMNENIATGLYFERGRELQSLISSSVAADTNKFYSFEAFQNNMENETTVGSARYPGLKNFMEARLAYLRTYPGFTGHPEIKSLVSTPERPSKNQQLEVTATITGAQRVFLYYRFARTHVFSKMAMENRVGSGDSIYAVNLLVEGKTVQYYLWAENPTAGIFSPEKAEHEFYTVDVLVEKNDIVVNEYFADENSGWIELYNNSSESLSLAGMYISQGSTRFQLPDTIMAKRSFFVIGYGSFASASTEIADFRLSLSGQDIGLQYSSENIINSLPAFKHNADCSIGRFPNGTGKAVFLIPGPKQYNQPAVLNSNEITVFPNPVSQTVFVSGQLPFSSTSIIIYNTMGQKVKEIVFNEEKQILTIPVDISGLAMGVYYVSVMSGQDIITRTIIVH